MRDYGSVQVLDVYADGALSVALTPNTQVQPVEWTVQAPKAGVEGNWPLAENIVVKWSLRVNQPLSGGSVIYGDQVFQAFDSYDVLTPLFGNTHPRDTFTGPIAKHVAEFFSANYTYGDGMVYAILAADGNYDLVVYQALPYAHEAYAKPHHFSPWLGWLNNTQVTTYLAPTSSLAGISTGATVENVSVSVWIEYVVSSELIINTINNFHLYEQPATGGSTFLLQGVGTANGLAAAKDNCRLSALLELSDNVGLGGALDPSTITSVTIPQIGLDVTQHPDAFVRAFRATMSGHRGSYAIDATSPVLDRAGQPVVISPVGANTGRGSLLSEDLLYMVYRWPGTQSQITKQVRVGGDIKVTNTFTSNPSSGTRRFVTNELREFTEKKKDEMVGRTGKAGKRQTIFSTGMPDPGDIARHTNKAFCLPERVVF